MSPTPVQDQTFMVADILDQIREFNSDNFEELDDFYNDTTMSFK